MSIETNRDLQRTLAASEMSHNYPHTFPNMEKEVTPHCSHNYEYSHKEYEQLSYGGTALKQVDVVVCTKCGNVKRN